ncbi:MAG TPA: FG-GAP-like repeat-containing protein [Kiritimatiellia bacterium]|nr:FG-GAP-like repeat-containing protein [Kiritimatiellia bacterium]HSA17959.1 FG-GAP-like repeat-containing protein [Kiritimatiellia bacterium]
MKRMVALISGLLVAGSVQAATLYVWTNSPANGPGTAWSNAFHTIQAAVDAAGAGGLVLVTNGMYSVGGRATPGGTLVSRVCLTNGITVRSMNGPNVTTIAGMFDSTTLSNGPLAVRCAYVSTGTVLSGFTLTFGHTGNSGNWPFDTGGGGALLMGGTISNCVLSGNQAHADGGGAGVWYGGEIWNSRIESNFVVTANGGGAYVRYGSLLRNCLFRGNDASASSGTGLGGGLCISSGGGSVENCTIVSNTAKQGGGVFTYQNGTNLNDIIWGNTATTSGDNWQFNTTGRYEYCCTTPLTGLPYGTGCISNDPDFVDGSYHVRFNSPCVDAGTNLPWTATAKDLDGSNRLVGACVDLGCYEAPFVLRVTHTVPRNGSNTVAVAASLVAQFNTNMMGSTITSNRFLVFSDQHAGRSGSVSFNSATNEATLDPSVNFYAGEEIVAELTRGITNAAGTKELPWHSWSFRAAAQQGNGVFLQQEPAGIWNRARTVALGDLNGDTYLDAFIVGGAGGVGTNLVYTNNGSGLLFDSGQRLRTTNGYEAVLGDVDRDGDLDAVVSWREWAAPSQVLTNNGAGQFFFGQNIATDSTYQIALAELNGDGWLDAFVTYQLNAAEVWTNNRAGKLSFNYRPSSAVLQCASAGDVNGDGFNDLVAGRKTQSGAQAMLNNSNGVFTWAGSVFGTGGVSGVSCIELGDLDGDGDLDAVVAHSDTGIRPALNDGSGTFTDSGQILGTYNLVRLADLDGDGDLDIGTATNLYLNNGLGTFTVSSTMNFGGWSDSGLDVGDLDNDGDVDAFVLQKPSFGDMGIFLNSMPEMQVLGTNGSVIENGAAPSSAAGTDFGATPEGLTITNRLSITNSGVVALAISGVTISGTGAARFQVLGVPAKIEAHSRSNFYVTFTAYLGTSTASVSIANNSANTPYVFGVQGARYVSSFRVTNTIPPNAANDVAAGADLVAQFSAAASGSTLTSNRFHAYSLLRGRQRGAISFNESTNEATLDLTADFRPGERIFAYLSQGVTNAAGTASFAAHAWSFFAEAANGNARFMENGQIITGYVAAAACGDMNGDGHLDAVLGLQEGTDIRVRVMLNDGHGVFSWGPAGTLVSGLYPTMVLGDMDGDGDLDVFVAMMCQSTVLLLNDGTGAFTASGQSFPAGTAVAVADFDGDGSLDAAVGDECSSDMSIHLNNGTGVFSHVHSNYVGAVEGMDVGDVDGDGDLDLYTAGWGNTLLNDGTGHFTAGGPVADSSYDAALGDLDGDGDLDAAVATASGLSGAQCLSVLLNDGAGHFTSDSIAGPANSSGWRVELGDLDADGDLDALVGGMLFSTSYKTWIFTNDGLGHMTLLNETLPSGEYCYTTSIGLGDLDEDGGLDLVIASTNNLNRPFWINAAPEMEVLGTNGATIGDPTLLVFEPPDSAKGTRMGDFPTGPDFFTNRLVVSNSGPGILRLRQPVLDRPDAPWFRVGSLPSTLPANATTNLDIIFVPGITGWDTLTARVTFTHAGWYTNSQGDETNMQIWISARGVTPLIISNLYSNAPACDIAHGAEVSAWFAEEPLASTVDSNALYVYGSLGGVWHGAVTYDAGGRVVSLYPESDARPGEYMTAVVPLVVSNAAATTRFRPFAWSFHAKAPDGTGCFTPGPDIVISNFLFVMNTALGDLDGDGDLDALVGLDVHPGYRIALLFNDGTGRLVERDALRPPAGCTDMIGPAMVSDLDSDGDVDIVTEVGASSENGLAVWKNDGTGHFTNTFVHRLNEIHLPSQVRLGDADGDGDVDVMFAMRGDWFSTNGPPIWLNDGTGQFSPLTNNSAGPMAFPPAFVGDIGDVDGDGDLDMVFSGGYNSLFPYLPVWLNDGRGRFTDSGQSLESDYVFSVNLGDLDGDSDLDIFAVRDYEACIWTNDGTGHFSFGSQTNLSASSGQHTCQGMADLDGDGDVDALVGAWGSNSLNQVLLNDGTGHFTASDAAAGTAGHRMSSMGDLNGDGSVDVLLSRIDSYPINPQLQVWLNQTWPKAGFGKALQFDGTDSLTVPGNRFNRFAGTNDFTIGMWVRPRGPGSLYHLDAEPGDLVMDLTVQADLAAQFELSQWGYCGGGLLQTPPLPSNHWSHVAIVKQGGTFRILQDGAVRSEGWVSDCVTNAVAPASDIRIGEIFVGDLDEIQIWNRGLTEPQVGDWMYRAPDRTHPYITNLVAHFDCNEGVGLRTTSREGPPVQADFSSGMGTNAWIDSGVRDWRTWVNHSLDGGMVGRHADGTSSNGSDWNLLFELISQSSFGTVQVTTANGFQFVPPTNQFGTNVFTYQVISTNGLTSSVATASVVVPTDYDQDSMADLWEQAQGLDPSYAGDAHGDKDDDKYDNLSEYVADTIATDSNSFLSLIQIRKTNSVAVVFSCTNTRIYSLEYNVELATGQWSSVVGPSNGTDSGAMTLTDTNNAVQRSYRVGVSRP